MSEFIATVADGKGWSTAALMLGAALSEGAGLALLAPMLAVFLGGGGRLEVWARRGFDLLGVNSENGRLLTLMLLFVAIVAARAVLIAARDRRLFALQQDFVDGRRLALVTAVAGARWRDLAGLRHTRVLQALSGEVTQLAVAVHCVASLTLAAVLFAIQGALVIALSPPLGLLAIAAAALAGLLSVPLTTRAFALGRLGLDRNVQLIDTAAQMLSGLKTALAQGVAGAFVARFANTMRDLAGEQRAFERRRAAAQTVNTIGAAAALAGLVVAGHAWGTPPASLLASLAVLSRMVGPALGAVRDARTLAQMLPAHTGLRSLERELSPGDTGINAGAVAIPPVDFGDGTIELDGVSLRYGDSGGVGPVSAAIPRGRIVGVVGASGSGKTTLADLICGLLAPDRGRITIGGTPLDERALPAWRARVAYVAQDGYLFHDTVRRNLMLGVDHADDAALWQALTIARADGLVRKLDAGLDAVVGERGARLSGGERQRLAIARAVLRAPDLLVLDEATTGIEIETEAAIVRGLAAMRPRPTILLITHRPEPLAMCSHVLLVEEGRVRAA